MFQAAAWLISQFYELTRNYALAIALVAVVIMLLLLPLTLKSTKSMLEMQRIQPEMRRLQQQHRGDRQKLNEEMMKLYQEHKVNPMASCLPLLAQMPIFLVMFRVLHKLTEKGDDGTFSPSYLDKNSRLYRSLDKKDEMLSFGLDLAKRPIEVIQDDPAKGIIYALLVIALGALYFVQQRMVASRTPASGMSPGQQKLMQYLPVGFAFFQLFFPVGLVIYYITQTLVRIAQQAYITRRFYKGEHSLGRQAQAAGARAREMAKEDGGGTGFMASLRQEAQSQKGARDQKPAGKASGSKPAAATSKRTTPPKSRPTPNRSARPAPPNRPKPSGTSRHSKPSKP